MSLNNYKILKKDVKKTRHSPQLSNNIEQDIILLKVFDKHNKTNNNFLSDVDLDNKMKDFKLDIDRHINEEISKINSRIDKVGFDFPKWAIGTVLVFIVLLFTFYTNIYSKFESINKDISIFKNTTEQNNDKTGSSKHSK